MDIKNLIKKALSDPYFLAMGRKISRNLANEQFKRERFERKSKRNYPKGVMEHSKVKDATNRSKT